MKFKCTANTSPIVIKRYFKMKIRSFFAGEDSDANGKNITKYYTKYYSTMLL